MLYLAEQGAGEPVRAAEIAQGLALPANYLSKILHTLVRAGVLRSERGPRGGFRLARSASEVSLADVIEPFDSLAQERFCLLGEERCSDDSPCNVHERWKQASDPMMGFFHNTVIADLLGKIDV